MVRLLLAVFLTLCGLVLDPIDAAAQEAAAGQPPLRLATVSRPPFAFVENGDDVGFSIELWQALMTEMGRETEILRAPTFPQMLAMVQSGEADAAAANISITADREAVMDFTQPIFDGGLRIMIPANADKGQTLIGALISRDLLIAIAAAFALLFVAGMLMWVFERKRQPYFDQPAQKAMFPAFWWALNLVVNGGFEERQPRSVPGRLLGVLLVVSSLFLVSVFVARITATMTVEAIQTSVTGINDLYGKRIGTTAGSTAERFLNGRDVRTIGYENFDILITAFEVGDLDAVVFDAPILAHYVNTSHTTDASLVGQVFLRENYGIALPSGSALSEDINRTLLQLRESGTYGAIRQKWFGPANG